jgi:hypothetical protein
MELANDQQRPNDDEEPRQSRHGDIWRGSAGPPDRHAERQHNDRRTEPGIHHIGFIVV